MTKRYFMVPPGALPSELAEWPHVGEYHYIDLDSHAGSQGDGFRVLVLVDGSKTAPEHWEELPHVLDGATTLGSLEHARHLAQLAYLGAKATHGGFTLAKLLAGTHGAFLP